MVYDFDSDSVTIHPFIAHVVFIAPGDGGNCCAMCLLPPTRRSLAVLLHVRPTKPESQRALEDSGPVALRRVNVWTRIDVTRLCMETRLPVAFGVNAALGCVRDN